MVYFQAFSGFPISTLHEEAETWRQCYKCSFAGLEERRLMSSLHLFALNFKFSFDPQFLSEKVCYQPALVSGNALTSKISHLSWLEFMMFLLAQSSILLRYLWMTALISSTPAIPPSLALFTDVMMMYFVPYSKLLIKRLNSVSSSIYPSMTFIAL